MTDKGKARGEPATVAECRQAIRFHEWELLRLVGELAGLREKTARRRREFERGRKACSRLWRKCRDRVAAIELMRDLISSSPDGLTVQTGAPVEPVPAGLAVLERLGQILDSADTESEEGLREFHQELSDLQEFAKDFFDYGGVKLVYELGELLGSIEGATSKELRELHSRVAELTSSGSNWCE